MRHLNRFGAVAASTNFKILIIVGTIDHVHDKIINFFCETTLLVFCPPAFYCMVQYHNRYRVSSMHELFHPSNKQLTVN